MQHSGTSSTSVDVCQGSGLHTEDASTLVEIALHDREDVLSKEVVGMVVLLVVDGVSVDDSFSLNSSVDVRGVAARGLVDEVDFVACDLQQARQSHIPTMKEIYQMGCKTGKTYQVR